MCRNYHLYWVQCGHLTNTFEPCERRPPCGNDLALDISTECGTVCINCASAPNDNGVPLPLRLNRGAEFAEQIQRHEAQRQGFEAGLAVQRIINDRENQIRQEEITLQDVNPQDMTSRQARRIRILFSRLQEETSHLEVVTAEDSERLENCRRAYLRIPSRHLVDLSEYEILTFTGALLQDTIQLQMQHPENEDVIQAVTGLRARQQQLQEEYDQHQIEREQYRTNRVNCEVLRIATRQLRATAVPTILSRVSLESAGGKDCSICGDLLSHAIEEKLAEYPVRMPCGHVYGEDCIKTWLKENDTCPLCREDYAFELAGEEPSSDFDSDGLQQIDNQTVAEEAQDILDRMEVLHLNEV